MILFSSQKFVFGRANDLSKYDFRVENFVAQKIIFKSNIFSAKNDFRVKNFSAENWFKHKIIFRFEIFGSEYIPALNYFRVES